MFKQARAFKAPPKYYVYKILVKGSTLSYIGLTKDFKRRSSDHYVSIRAIIRGVINKNENINYYSTAHLTIAKFLYKKYNRKGYVSFMSGLTITVIKEFKCPVKAKECETEYIARYTRWGKKFKYKQEVCVQCNT